MSAGGASLKLGHAGQRSIDARVLSPGDHSEFRYLELRQAPAADSRTLAGIVARYGDRANLGRFTETIAPGALTIAPGARLNLQHQRHILLARDGAGLKFNDGDHALEMRAELPQTRAADDVLEGVRAGLYRGLSAEMVVHKDSWSGTHRTVQRADLRSVAVVDNPAYPLSALEMRERGGVTANEVWERRRRAQAAPLTTSALLMRLG